MPLIGTKAAASSQGFGQFAESGAEPVYIENVFSTYLYTGTGSTQTITNGIDLAGKGGLVWSKVRDSATYTYVLTSNANGWLVSSSTAADAAPAYSGSGFLSNGFNTIGAFGDHLNWSGRPFVSWTFRKQPKFFDIVTVTGQATQTTFNHNLGSVPGCIIIKCTNSTGDWFVYHRSTGSSQYLVLNSTSAQAAYTNWCVATSTTVTVLGGVMGNANSFVVYLFAHDAGGFGLSGTDNVISCGSYTTDGSGNATVNLGYEPQWVLFKPSGIASHWVIVDSMRGMLSSGYDNRLFPSLSATEDTGFGGIAPTATGFNGLGLSGSGLGSNLTYIYIAIRRGPMKVPTSGTEVFTPIARTGTGANATIASGFTTDLQIVKSRSQPYNNAWFDRLRGTGIALFSDSTVADQNYGAVLNFQNNTGVNISSETLINQSGQTFANFSFRRAPGFFDVVCYTGDGTYSAIPHNLGVPPEFMIQKSRTSTQLWYAGVPNKTGNLNNNFATDNLGSLTWTATTFQPWIDSNVNYVVYLFATLAGVSKVGSYTGTGTTQTINCGFTAGARFVLIKRTDSTGDWYVWDSARGIVAGNDPYLLLNSTAAEVTSTDYIDTASTGFEISSTAPAAINASGGSYIFLAIA